MAVFLDLPPECIIHVFLQMLPRQIAKSRLISRAFRAIIDDSLVLQYIMELDNLGLVPPIAASNDLSLYNKVCALKEKRRTRDKGIDGMAHIYLYPNDRGNIVLQEYKSHAFSRGVLAFKGKDWPTKLGIYQFASENRGIDCDRYKLNCPPRNYMMAVEPSFDLLALFGTVDEGLAFHLLSLRTGLPHPSASSPMIPCFSPTGIEILTYLTISIEIVGRHIVHMEEISERCTSLITIWDWVSGQIVTSTKVLGYSVAFLSEDIFMVPPPVGAYEDGEPHYLALYTCREVPPGGPARCIARFYFPISDSIKISCTRFEPSPLPSVWSCSIPLAYPPRVYDTSPTSHYLALSIQFRDVIHGYLFIWASALFSLLDTLATDHDQCLSVPWPQWSSATSWIHSTALNSRMIGFNVFGHLAIWLSYGDDYYDWEVGIYDLRTSKEKALIKSQLDPMSPEERVELFLSDGSTPVQQPLLVKLFSIPVDVLPWEDDWYKETHHQRGVDLLVDDEHIIIFKPPSNTSKASLHVYPF
ncbi:unnamed protein product [Rhizoctonia solani]|uniref:F-box domain-containing protein n=1 Tax=Rhizoctonia solani TaxID=456999 RepID=A0A8H3H211_9AGAM|nr:unnamed protein product [Rhizoctonia solani]